MAQRKTIAGARWIRTCALVLIASLMIVSCEHCNPFAPSDMPPEAVLTVYPTSVTQGTSVNVKLQGTARSVKNLKDATAKSDKFIVSYHLDIDYDTNGTIDKTIEQQSPIEVNEPLHYVGKATFSGIVTDSRGLTSDVKRVEVLVNDAPLTNHTPSCILTSEKSSLKKGENTLISIDGTDEDGKSDIVNYKIKIDYDNNGVIDKQLENSTPFSTTEQFDIVGTAKVYGEVKDSKGAIDAKTLNILVSETPVNKLPEVNLTGVDFSLLDGKQKTINLPEPTDEDTPGTIPYTNAEIIQGNENIESISLNPATRELTIKAKAVSQNQNYKIRLSFGTDNQNKNTAELESIIQNLCNIRGRIESNSDLEGVGKPGEVKGYEVLSQVYNTITTGEILIPETRTENGNFEIQASKPTTTLLLRARFDEPGNLDGDNKSYVRNITFDASKDYDNVIMTCETSPNFPVTKAQFAQWIGNRQLRIWDLTTLEGIEILHKHPDPSKGEFSATMKEAIAERIRASNGAEALFNNKISLDEKLQIDDENTTNFHYNYVGGFIGSHPNWIVIVPVYDLRDVNLYPCKGLTGVQYLNNNPSLYIINGAVIRLDTMTMWNNMTVLKGVSMHELNHSILTPSGEGNSIVNPYSVMGNMLNAGPADIKKANMVYNGRYNLGEQYLQILGLEF